MARTPKSGKLPALVYEFCEDDTQHAHRVSCGCGAGCSTSDPIIARRFVQSHVGEHARGRIFKPQAEPDEF